MKKTILLLLISSFFMLVVSAAPVNKGNAYVVMEATTKRVLAQSNMNTQYLIASTAKILTAITAIENEPLDEVITIRKEDVCEVGSKVYLSVNEQITREDLLYALMLRSANDAASALSGNNQERFISQMNTTAKKIGMKNSVFTNGSGLDEREFNLSTAYDMALLSAYASKNQTFVQIASAHSYTAKTSVQSYTWVNKHRLVKADEDFLWGKTGYTKKSGRILVSNYKKDNMNLIVVTINDGNDWNHHRALVNQLGQYEFITVFKKGIYDTKLDISYYIYAKEDITIPIKVKEEEVIKLQFLLLQEKAYLVIYINNQFVAKKQMDVYTKTSLDIDLIIELFQ